MQIDIAYYSSGGFPISVEFSKCRRIICQHPNNKWDPYSSQYLKHILEGADLSCSSQQSVRTVQKAFGP